MDNNLSYYVHLAKVYTKCQKVRPDITNVALNYEIGSILAFLYERHASPRPYGPNI